MREETKAKIRERLANTSNARARVRKLVAEGNWRAAEPNDERAAAFKRRRETARETVDFQPVYFLARGAVRSRAIARVEVRMPGYIDNGTGFMISPELFITNAHVIPDAQRAAATFIYFLDELAEDGKRSVASCFRLAPDRFFIVSDEGVLDYAIVAVGACEGGSAVASDYGCCPLSNTPDRHVVGMPLNIIQHPEGRSKEVVVRKNLLTDRFDDMLLYETDTQKGSSGSPVLNDDWDVVALHHYGEPSPGLISQDGTPIRQDVNEGIRISSIFQDVERRIAASQRGGAAPANEPALTQAQIVLARAALTISAAQAPQGLPPLGHRPRPPGESERILPASSTIQPSATPVMEQNVSETQSFIVPLEISVRIGDPAARHKETARETLVRPALARRPFSERRSEADRLDRDYSNRKGFKTRFVSGMPLDLGVIAAPQKNKIAPLKDGDRSGELKYQNFSVVLNRDTKLALLTATNIDGPSYIAINRASGDAADDQPGEGDTWYKDDRVEEQFYAGAAFYKDWSHFFDRGHLTRRNDPTWGTPEEAKRANYDTFHYTNCSPQHWMFNQSIKLWQGIERYVLEKGLWETGVEAKLAVLQGPVYEGADEITAGDQIVPTGFWKIVAWNGKNGKKAVGLLADQTRLLSKPRGYVGERPASDADVFVQEFHTQISEIGQKAGLDFSMLHEFDTFGSGLPRVGERQRRVTDLEQIPLA